MITNTALLAAAIGRLYPSNVGIHVDGQRLQYVVSAVEPAPLALTDLDLLSAQARPQCHRCHGAGFVPVSTGAEDCAYATPCACTQPVGA